MKSLGLESASERQEDHTSTSKLSEGLLGALVHTEQRTSSGIQLPSKCRLMAVPQRSDQVPLPGATVRMRFGTGATRSVSLAPASSTHVRCAPYLSVCT